MFERNGERKYHSLSAQQIAARERAARQQWLNSISKAQRGRKR